MFSDAPIRPWLDRLRDEVPGLDPFDVHTHIGANDPDGYRCSPEQLAAALDSAGARGVVFPMHEPDGYPPANDRILAAATESGGRLTAFCRLDPDVQPVAEAERCLEAGAAGLKLHPRAEGFTLDHPALPDVFALADERRVPILCHAGRGIPALGRHALDLCGRFRGARLILAHAGICDLAWIWRPARDHANLFFDTSWWAPADLLALLALVPPGQVLFGSDAPYATPAFALTLALRYSLQTGLSAEQVRGLTGGQVERLVAGEEPLDLGPAPGAESLPRDPLLDRIYGLLMSAVGQMMVRREPHEVLALTRLACEVGDDAPQTAVCSSVLALLEERRRHVAEGRGDGRPPRFAPGIHLVVLAAGIARTPDVPLPPDPVPVNVAERAARG
ncbi:MAG TPA: amidohydrolase family protein [Thermoleophilaceae bacterium]|nr:amidohydrolase family protein [Thermoleophilaceae bacterium]